MTERVRPPSSGVKISSEIDLGCRAPNFTIQRSGGAFQVFTGIVDHVDLYRSADSNEWVNEMCASWLCAPSAFELRLSSRVRTCRGQNSERRVESPDARSQVRSQVSKTEQSGES